VSRFPDRYREVSVSDVPVALTLEALRALLTSRPVYRRTRYIVARNAGAVALVQVHKNSTTPLFCAVREVELLAGPAETTYVHRPDLDTAIPSELVKAAEGLAPGTRCVVVEGRYGHVSFVLDPTPVRVRVLDVAPPWPAKLVDQVERVLQTAEDLPPLTAIPAVIALTELVSQTPSGHYLLPCRGGGMQVPGAQVSYLDEVPPQADWTLLGCARSRAIHDFFYDSPVPQIDTCPRTLASGVELGRGEVLLTKCCLLEEHIETDGRAVIVPWGASFAHLREALAAAVDLAQESAP
jgi:hypothetical protein